MMDEYLSELISKDFVTEVNNKEGKTYSVTEKGREFLNKYQLIIEFTDSFGLG
jgi:predicted transcriptional regulator